MLHTKLSHFFAAAVSLFNYLFTLLPQVQESLSDTLVLGDPAVGVVCSWRDLPLLTVINLGFAKLSSFCANTAGSPVLHKAQVIPAVTKPIWSTGFLLVHLWFFFKPAFVDVILITANHLVLLLHSGNLGGFEVNFYTLSLFLTPARMWGKYWKDEVVCGPLQWKPTYITLFHKTHR